MFDVSVYSVYAVVLVIVHTSAFLYVIFILDVPATTEIYTYDTLFPYTTLFRSTIAAAAPCSSRVRSSPTSPDARTAAGRPRAWRSGTRRSSADRSRRGRAAYRSAPCGR